MRAQLGVHVSEVLFRTGDRGDLCTQLGESGVRVFGQDEAGDLEEAHIGAVGVYDGVDRRLYIRGNVSI